MVRPCRSERRSWVVVQPILLVVVVVIVILLPVVIGWPTTTGAALFRRSHHYHHHNRRSSWLAHATACATAEDPAVTANHDVDAIHHHHTTAAGLPTPTTTRRRALVHQLVRIATTGTLLAYRVPSARAAAAEPEVDPFALMDALVSDTVDEILTNGNTTNNHNHNIQQEGTRPTPLRDGITGNGENNKNTSNEHTSTPNSDMDSALRDAQNRRTVLPRTHG